MDFPQIFIAFCLIAFLVLALAEIIARAFLKFSPYRVFAAGRKDWMKLDLTVHPQLEESVKFEINGIGERGTEPPKGNFFKVLAVGGSAIESFFIDQEKSWPLVAQRILNEDQNKAKLKTNSVQVGNIGRSGVDSGSLFLILQKVLENYKSIDVIIIMVGASDVLRWLELGAQPDQPATALEFHELFAQHPENKFLLSPKKSAVAEILRRLKVRLPTKKENAGRWYRKARAMKANAKEIREDIESDEIVVNAFSENFRKCIKLCKEKSEKIIVFPQPWFHKAEYSPEEKALFWNGGVGKAYKEDLSIYYSEQVITGLMQKIYDKCKEIAVSESIEVVDLLKSIEPSMNNFYDQFHFSPTSSQLVGEIVANKILSLKI